jgi:hypothetical protein
MSHVKLLAEACRASERASALQKRVNKIKMHIILVWALVLLSSQLITLAANVVRRRNKQLREMLCVHHRTMDTHTLCSSTRTHINRESYIR